MDRLTPKQIDFIGARPMFFVATAGSEGRVNVSPKGMDSFRVLGPQRIAWLNLTGSGNESAAHVAETMHGTSSSVSSPPMGGARQIFDLSIDLVTSSCRSGVPRMTVDADRGAKELEPFRAAKSTDELHEYWARKNTSSIDGYPTKLFAE